MVEGHCAGEENTYKAGEHRGSGRKEVQSWLMVASQDQVLEDMIRCADSS